MAKKIPTLEEIKSVMELFEDLPDGAFWEAISDTLELDGGWEVIELYSGYMENEDEQAG